MSNVEIMDLTLVSSTFPRSPENEIAREHFLDAIDKLYENNIDLVIIEGQEGIGKTTLQVQFAKRYPHSSLSIFIKPASRLAYSPEYIRKELIEQINWILNKENISTGSVDDKLYNNLIYELHKYVRTNNANFYFILDGLQEIPEYDSSIQDIIIKEILPFGFSGFRFLISGDSEKLNTKVHSSINSKSYPIAPFSLDETNKYLKDLELDESRVQELHKMCRGIPGHIAIIRRMLNSGTQKRDILSEDLDKLPDFIAIELKEIENVSEEINILLSLITYGHNFYSNEDLSRILKLDQLKIQEFLEGLGFLYKDTRTNKYYFISDAHRRYASKMLKSYKETAYELLIDDLLKPKHLENDNTLLYLPNYYEQAGRLQELLKCLDTEHFTKLLIKSQSLNTLHERANLGLTSAVKLDSYKDLMRFGIHKSLISELNTAEILHSEIEAMMSVKDYESAIELAQGALLKEHRVELLSIIANIQHEHGLEPEHEIMDQIRTIYNQIDNKSFGERSIVIASALIRVDPDLALKIIESASKETDNEINLDVALTWLSFEVLKKEKDQHRTRDIYERTSSMIKDPILNIVSKTFPLIVGNYSVDQIISYVKNIDQKKQLTFLCEWCKTNKNRSDSGPIIDYALDLLIKDINYTPKTRDLRTLSNPLPSISDFNKSRELVGRFDSLTGSIQKFGTTEDYIRLQLTLATTESKYDNEAALNRVMEVYWAISELKDLNTKTNCMAWMVSSLEEIDQEKKLEDKEGLHTLCREELLTDINKLLEITSNHYHAIKRIIRALSKQDPEMILELIKCINTQERRDLSNYEFLTTLIEYPIDELNINLIKSIIPRIDDSYIRDNILLEFSIKLSKSVVNQNNVILSELSTLIETFKDITDSYKRCIASCNAYIFLISNNLNVKIESDNSLLNQINESWDCIDEGWTKIDTGYKIAKILSQTSRDLSQEFLAKTQNTKDELKLDIVSYVSPFIYCLKLAIRAFGGLINNKMFTEHDLEWLEQLITHIPSKGERARLWCDIALRFHTHKEIEYCQKISNDHVRPLITDIPDDDANFKNSVIIDVAPCLYLGHRNSAIEIISKLPRIQNDSAINAICNFILTKLPPFEPYNDTSKYNYLISYEDAIDICFLLESVNNDQIIYKNIEKVCQSMVSAQARAKFTKEQKNDIAIRLEKIINTKLPDTNNIKHDGYKIISLSLTAALKQYKKQNFDYLINSARQIPNISDRILVNCILASSFPNKERERSKILFMEAEELIDSMPLDLDKIDRLVSLAEMITDSDVSESRRFLKEAMNQIKDLVDPEITHDQQKRIIDLAHTLDPKLADSLAEVLDDDPARISSKLNIKNELKITDIKKKMLDNKNIDYISEQNQSNLSQAAWRNLGSLNARRIEPLRFEIIKDYLNIVSRVPLRNSYPMLSWAIENLTKMYSKTNHAGTYIYPLFEASMLSAELARRIMIRSPKNVISAKITATKPLHSKEKTLFGPNERQEAINFLKGWFFDHVGDNLIICDPYFCIDDLEILRILVSVQPNCKVQILTSKKKQEEVKLVYPWDQTYRTHWRLNISDQDCPDTEIIIAGTESRGDLPIHDRCMLSNEFGIRLGTSINSLGINKTSEISYLSSEQVKEFKNEINPYLERSQREYNKEKILFQTFTL